MRVRRTVFNGAINPPKTAKSNSSVRLTKEAVRLLASRPRERVVVPHPCRDPYKLPQPHNFLGSPRQQGSSPFLTSIDTQ